MSRLQRLPYLLPKLERVKVVRWEMSDRNATKPVPLFLPDWDAAVSIQIIVTIEIDVAGVLSDCGLSEDTELRLAVVWRSHGTGIQGRGSFIDLNIMNTGETFLLTLDVSGDQLAHNLIISVVLALIRPGRCNNSLAPKLPGSILWNDSRNILLGGQSARFPMEVIDFAKSSWLPEYAGWFLDWNPENLDQTVLGGMRLYINARHASVRRAVSESNSEDYAIREAIRFDVARVMIAEALKNDEFLASPGVYANGTIGAALRRLIQMLFPTDSLQTLKNELTHYSQRFECRLQDKLKVFNQEEL